MSEKPQPKKKRVRKLSPFEQREQMAAAGDVEGLWDVIRQADWGMVDLQHCFKLLMRAIEKRSCERAHEFSEMMFPRMLSLTSFLMFRAHFIVHNQFEQYDRAMQSQGPPAFPPKLEDIHPRLFELQRHVGELLETRARTSRLWELARIKRRKNVQAEADGKQQVGDDQEDAKPNGAQRAAQHMEVHNESPLLNGHCVAGGPLGHDRPEARDQRTTPAAPGEPCFTNGWEPAGLGGPLRCP